MFLEKSLTKLKFYFKQNCKNKQKILTRTLDSTKMIGF